MEAHKGLVDLPLPVQIHLHELKSDEASPDPCGLGSGVLPY